MPDRITVKRFIEETRADLSSPVTSSFAEPSTLNSCRSTIANLEEILDDNRTHLRNLKKSIKSLTEAGKNYVTSECLLAENLEKLGMFVLSKEAEPSIGTAFLKFSVVAKELSAIMKNMLNNYNNIVLFPLESLLKGDLKEVKGDLRKPFDKASKDYDAKFTKMEKEKKQQAKEAGFPRTEVTPHEIADEMEKERRYFQLQMCEYLIRISEVKIKKGVDLAQHFVDYYHAQNSYFCECGESLDSIRSYTETLVVELQQLRLIQENEKKSLVALRDEVRETLQLDKEKSLERAGYTLHGQQGDILHGTTIRGYLLKRSEGVRKVWQKRYCVVENGLMTLAYTSSSVPNHTLNLLTCQVKGSVEKEGKKSPIFILVTHNRNYLFQAEDQNEMNKWISVLSNSRKEALEKAFGEHGNGLQKDNLTDETYDLRQRIVRLVQSLPGNNVCADCNAPDPTWLSTNLGVLTCIECSGIHREMGVHVSRVRSLTLDNLGTAELLIAKAVGNGGFNEIMEATLNDDCTKPTPSSKMEERKEFIRAKYINHQYAQQFEESPFALSKSLAKAVHKKDILAVLQVFAEGADLSAPLHEQNEKHTTALHYAVKNEDLTSLHIVDFLAQNTGNIDVLSDGNSALHLASSLSNTECIKVLVRAGANPSQVNIHGQTALDIAMSEGHHETIELLKSVQGGKLTHCDNVKIEWGLEQAENIYEDPCNFGDLRIDLQSEDEAIEEPVKVPATPPRNRRRPISIAAFPAQTPIPRSKTVGNDSELTSSVTPSAPSLRVIGELKRRHGLGEDLRKNLKKIAPPPPPTSTIPTTPPNVYQAAPPSTFSTFSQRPQQKSNSLPHGDSPPPTPPVRVASVSRQSRTPIPVPKTRPLSPPTTGSQLTRKTSEKSKKISTPEMRSKPTVVAKPKLEESLSDPGKLSRIVSSSPPSMPRAGSPPVLRTASPPAVAPSPSGSPPPRPPKDIVKDRAKSLPEKTRVEASPQRDLKGRTRVESKGDTPPPELPPRVISPTATRPKIRRVQALYDCEADNDDELSFSEGEIILVSAEADPDWWLGHIEGDPKREGVFPITFVRVLETE